MAQPLLHRGVALELEAAPSPSLSSLSLMLMVAIWRASQDVHYRVSAMGGKVMDVLKGMSGTVPAQTFSVVLGPSGAGKSSLFDVLLGVAEGVVFRG
jgi:ABC-type transport system involved in cytochrome bd biosynthesis fused ATPase/permease subunit